MAFTPITYDEIAPGQPVRADTAMKTKENFDDHELRLQGLEGGASTTYPPLIFRVNGHYSAKGAQNGVLKTTTNFPIKILGVRLIIDVAGSAGTTQIDVKTKPAIGGSFATILTTQPSVASSAGNDAISTNGVVNPALDTIPTGNLIRLDLTSVQNNGRGFTVRIDYTRG